MDSYPPLRKDQSNDISSHMPETRYVDTTNGRREELSLSLFHYLNHSNTPIRTKPIEEVAAEAHRRAYRIFSHWNMLNAILLEHESVLRTRWIKKTREQRKKILLTAWPNMASSHRPDMQATGRESVEQRRAGTKFRNEFLFPYINLEDLLKAKNLLLFFQSRGHTKPDVFAHHDLMAALLGRRSTAIQPLYIDGYTMFFCGILVPDLYGFCASWDEVPFGFTDDDGFDLMWAGIGWQPGDGLVILEVQERILEFLVRCAESILHDFLPFKTPRTSFWPLSQQSSMTELPSPLPMTPIPSEASWASVAAAAAEAPYRVPVQFDFSRLQRLVDARRAEAEDSIWTLREDPLFFQETANDWAQHRQAVLRNKNGKPHSSYDTPEYWTSIFRYVVQSAYQRLAMWDTIKKSLDQLAALHQLYPVDGIRISPLPWDYAQELCHFSYLIKRVRPILLSDFHGIVASPPLRDYYIREYYPDPRIIIYKRKENSAPVGSVLWSFLWLVDQFAYPDQLELAGIYNFLDELERVSRNCTITPGGPEDDLISPFIASAISELAVVCELQRQLDWHQPRILPNTVSDDDRDTEYIRRTTRMSIFDKVEANFFDVGMPVMKMKYPAEKRQNAMTVREMRDAEASLDKFWQTVDEFYRVKTGKVLHDLFADLLSPRQLQRTSEWVDPAPPPTPEAKINLEIDSDSFFPISFDQHPSQATVSPPKTKVKTRRTTAEPATDNETYFLDRPPKADSTVAEPPAEVVHGQVGYPLRVVAEI